LVHEKKGDYDKAIEYYKKSLSVKLKTLREDHPDIARSYADLGLKFLSKGDNDNAVEYFNKALAIQQKILNRQKNQKK
jgi:tetratricopeptide (TPR) repeat protein